MPVKVHTATESKTVRFHEVDVTDGARIEHRRVCTKEDEEVPYEQIAREHEGTVVTDEELAIVAPRKTKTIDIEAFVDLADVDPIHFDHPYVLTPAGEGEGAARAYRLLVDVLGGTERVALGRFVLRTKEHLVAIRVRDGLLALTTMRFHDEVRG